MKVTVLSMPVGGPGGKRIVHRGVWISAGTRLSAVGDDLPGKIDFTLDVHERPVPRLVVSELSISRRRQSDRLAIQSSTLREIRVPDLLAEAVRAIVKKHPYLYDRAARERVADDPQAFSSTWKPPTKRTGHGRIFPDSKLPEVARIYLANPRRGYVAVAEKLNVPRSTAGEYVRRAREAGLIDGYDIRGRKQ
jgi:hypothetical protein